MTRVASGDIGPDGCLASDLWVDGPDALSEVERRLAAGRFGEPEAEKLAHFIEHGFLTVDLGLPDEVFEALDRDIDRMWSERPDDVAFSIGHRLVPMSTVDPTRDRRAPYRITNLQSCSEMARRLYLDETVFRLLWAIFDRRPVATSSIYFEFGSYQPLHRDPVHVSMEPPSHLLAAWIALEDIDPRSGVLAYVPGSHRLPYFRFESGDFRFDHFTHGEAEASRMAAWDQSQCEEARLEVVRFAPKRGTALIWHHSLLHGGGEGDTRLTRKSFVSHYTTMQYYEASRQLVASGPEPGAELRKYETHRILGELGRYGFDAPIRGKVVATAKA